MGVLTCFLGSTAVLVWFDAVSGQFTAAPPLTPMVNPPVVDTATATATSA